MPAQHALGVIVGVGVTSFMAAGAMFLIVRQAERGASAHATNNDVAAYCATRAQSVTATDRALHETTCRVTLNGALESLAEHQFVDAIDQIRAVDALLGDQPPVVASAAPTVAPSVAPAPVPASKPSPPAKLPKRVRTKRDEDTLPNPYADTPAVTQAHPKPASSHPALAGDLADPFSK